MSKTLGKTTTIVQTVLGPMSVVNEYILEYDIEDMVRTRAESQARIVQMINVGRDTTPSGDEKLIPSIYTNITDDLED